MSGTTRVDKILPDTQGGALVTVDFVVRVADSCTMSWSCEV